tara:strand:+ start:208 stop:2016 length:1809 start_codon:yes stop_codon:yes gene_type:complete
MCGIAGINSEDSRNLQKSSIVVEEMLKLLKSRGPDAKGRYISGSKKTILGHRRLSILDIDERSNQPFLSPDGRYALSYNGEIYNFKELRKKYFSNEVFTTESDTEVLLKLVTSKGLESLSLLRGMFSLALWDNLEETLTLIRDPYGIKPLYYVKNNLGFCFASQAKALVKSMPELKVAEPAGIVGFYLWGNIPEPWTLYKGVKCLPKGSFMKVKDGEIIEQKEWHKLRDNWLFEIEKNGNPQSIISESVNESVKSHLVSDVPLCIFLSGGIDSCTVASIASNFNKNLEGITLSYGEFGNTSNDELPLAQLAAKEFNIRSHNRLVTKKEFLSDIPNILNDMDQPSVDGINTWYACKAAKERGYKVALSGAGGDELFCGYPSFYQLPKIQRIFSILNTVPYGLHIAKKFPKVLQNFFKSEKTYLISDYSENINKLFFFKRALFLPEEIVKFLDAEIYKDGITKILEDQLFKLRETSFLNPLSELGFLESNYYLGNQLLKDGDWASMAHSIELRTPLVDSKLLKSIAPLVKNFKRGEGKKMLSNSATIEIPKQIVNKKKTGFGFPMESWTNEAVSSLSLDSKSVSSSSSWARNWSKALIDYNVEL